MGRTEYNCLDPSRPRLCLHKERGRFNAAAFECHGIPSSYCQDNHSHSARGVLRGIHYQIKQPQGKLIRVVTGEVFDVAVDLRRSSPTFGKWAGFRLSAANNRNDCTYAMLAVKQQMPFWPRQRSHRPWRRPLFLVKTPRHWQHRRRRVAPW